MHPRFCFFCFRSSSNILRYIIRATIETGENCCLLVEPPLDSCSFAQQPSCSPWRLPDSFRQPLAVNSQILTSLFHVCYSAGLTSYPSNATVADAHASECVPWIPTAPDSPRCQLNFLSSARFGGSPGVVQPGNHSFLSVHENARSGCQMAHGAQMSGLALPLSLYA